MSRLIVSCKDTHLVEALSSEDLSPHRTVCLAVFVAASDFDHVVSFLIDSLIIPKSWRLLTRFAHTHASFSYEELSGQTS